MNAIRLTIQRPIPNQEQHNVIVKTNKEKVVY